MKLKFAFSIFLAICQYSFAQPSENPITPILFQYENELFKLVQNGNSDEQAAAIEALGILASPKYENAKNLLLKSSSTDVQSALINAIFDMGDESKDAEDFIYSCLRGNSPILIDKILENYDFKADFSRVWDPEQDLFLWTLYARSNRFNFDKFKNVSKVKPWHDPTWKHVPANVQIQLLAKAGTHESIELLKNSKLLPQYLVPAEKIDAAILKPLLSSQSEVLKNYANSSLFPYHEAPAPTLKELGKKEIIATSTEQILAQRMTAVIREYRYDLFPEILKQYLELNDDYLQVFWSVLKESPNFLANLPKSTAHECYQILVEKKDKPLAWRLQGLLARGSDEENLWEAWIKAMDKWDPMIVDPVYFGFNLKSAQLRELIPATFLVEIINPYDLNHLHHIQSALKDTNGYCKISLLNEFPVNGKHLPLFPLQIWELTNNFLSQIKSKYNNGEEKQLFHDLLRYRGIKENPDDPEKFSKHLNDSRIAIRYATLKQLEPYLERQNDYLNSSVMFRSEARTLLAEIQQKKKFNTISPKWSWPGQGLSIDQRKWLESFFKNAKESDFASIVKKFDQNQNAPEFEPTNWLTERWQEPSNFFLQYASQYKTELENLARIGNVHQRYAALWALWLKLRDEFVVQELFKDTQSSEEEQKINALYLLQRFRYQPSSHLYPRLLKESDWRLRWIGILGVRAFRMNDLIPELISLTKDPEIMVAARATEALGYVKSTEARNALIDLLAEETLVADSAQKALQQYREVQDLEYFADRLEQHLTITQRDRLFVVVTLNTFRMPESFITPDPTNEELQTLIKDWISWWKTKGRNTTNKEWFQSMIDDYVQTVSRQEENSTNWSARKWLQHYLPNVVDTAFMNEESVENLKHWWAANRNEPVWNLVITDQSFSTYGNIENLDFLYLIDRERTLQTIIPQSCFNDSPYLTDFFLKRSPSFMQGLCSDSCLIEDKVFEAWKEFAFGTKVQ
jgi:HEAT repeat protein